MIKIKLNNQFPEWDWMRQTPQNSGIWKNAQFFVNRDDITDCDFFFVMGGLNKVEKVNCPKENVFFIALENKDIQHYNQAFLNQFYNILTHRDDIKHPRIVKWVFPAYWLIGMDTTLNKVVSDKSYDFLRQNSFGSLKTELISVIASNKTVTEGHMKRLEFVSVLKKEFGSQIHVYGRGINDFTDKWDVLAPYKYHIALENSSFDDEITEKLYDCFLAGCYGFYHGAKNAKKYFKEDSFCHIDVSEPTNAVAVIKDAIANKAFEENRENVMVSKGKVLDKYNLFNSIWEVASSCNFGTSTKTRITFYPENLPISKSIFSKIASLKNKVVAKF
jgi:hypothetical protein